MLLYGGQLREDGGWCLVVMTSTLCLPFLFLSYFYLLLVRVQHHNQPPLSIPYIHPSIPPSHLISSPLLQTNPISPQGRRKDRQRIQPRRRRHPPSRPRPARRPKLNLTHPHLSPTPFHPLPPPPQSLTSLAPPPHPIPPSPPPG